MRILLLRIVVLAILLSSTISAQTNRETRAVWVTTNFRLDWPPNTTDIETQQNSLREIFKNLNSKKFNTVYFQVRSNGTVMYNSDIEPTSHYISGEVGGDLSYDPLQYAINLGKEYNLEVHAWVNMMRCFSGTNDRILKHPKHIRNAHPDWTVRFMDENGKLSYWMNPGYFRAQDYLVNILLEISNKYDIDGIQLDFFRYPDKKFEDDKYFSNYGLNVSLGDWRRNNLTTILRKFREQVNPLNPYLKVGATPIGIRKSKKGAIGWEGYSSVFQDTEQWLEQGLVDYLVPQIYWDFEKNPRFDIVASDWVNKSYNKNIVLGLAAYKSEVNPQLSRMIDYSRDIGASGVSFFRYDNISSKNYNFFSDLSFPSNMEWKVTQDIPSINKINCSYTKLADDEVIIGWKDNEENVTNTHRNYALVSDKIPIKLLSLNKNKLKLKFGIPSRLIYDYQICKLDRLWNYSSISNTIFLEISYLVELKNSSKLNLRPLLYKQNEKEAILSITSPSNQTALLDIFTKENLRKQQLATLKIGLNIITIEENFNVIKTLRITYGDNNKQEELNFY